MMMSNIDGATSSSASVGNCRQTASFSDNKSEAAGLISRRRTEVRRMKSLSQEKSVTVTDDDCFSRKRRLEKQNNRMTTLAAAADKATGEVEIERENFSYKSISVIGRRREMEDAVSVEVGFVKETSKKYDFYGVYDGHGGSRVAYACRDRLHKLLAKEMVESSEEMDWERMMLECFAKMDIEVTQTEEVGSIGSTAVVAVVGDREVVVGNCGDSRAVLSCGGATMPLSNDHKPDRPDELARIENSGGRVLNWNGQRVLGVLATSRSIGDQQLKPYVIAKPEVRVHRRSKEDEFLVLASDGLWDVISNDLACHVVRKCLEGRIFRRRSQGVNGEESSRRTADAAAVLTELAMARGSKDNISVIVINLKST